MSYMLLLADDNATTHRVLETLTFMVLPEFQGVHASSPSGPTALRVSSDGSVLYLVHFTSLLGLTVSFTSYGGLRGGALMPLASLPPTARTWGSGSVPPGSYEVRVAASNSGGTGPMSAPFEFSVGVSTIPEAPVNLEATVADDVVKLRWFPAPAGPAPGGYDVEVASSGSANFATLRRVTFPELAATNVPSGTWAVRVRAVTDGGRSAPSNVVTVPTTPCHAAPGAPSNLVSLGTSVFAPIGRLQWSPPSTGGAEGYVIEAGLTSAASDVRIASPGPGLAFEAPAPPGIYFARVRARNACGESAPSNEVVVFVPSP
jgi:hypothetical protein